MKLKDKKGITLIALVITIIILLILAGISINALAGENGIFKSSMKAKEEYEISQDIETLKLEYNTYIADKISEKNKSTFLEYLEGKEYLVEYDDDTKLVGKVVLNDRVYLVDETDNIKIEYLQKAATSLALMPKITNMETTVLGSSVDIDVTLKNSEGIKVKYTLEKVKNEKTEKIEETEEVEDLSYNFDNLITGETYIITVEVKNEYGIAKRKATIEVVDLRELTEGKASFSISPSDRWQKEVIASIISTYSDKNTSLQYKKGETGEWTDYIEGFAVNRNMTLYGRYYNKTTEEIGYTFTEEIEIIDSTGPIISIKEPEVTGKTIKVEIENAVDNEAGMPDRIEYTYYIKENGTYIAKSTTGSSYTFEGLTAGTTYNIKITTVDRLGNVGEKLEEVTTSDPIKVSKITLDKTEVKTNLSTTVKIEVKEIAPENADDKTVEWSSSNESVATVEDGIVTPKELGTTVITCSSVDGGSTATCSVEVIDSVLIYTRADLESIPTGKSTRGKTYLLMDDIDLSGKVWSMLGHFYGTLDGNGHYIKNLCLDYDNCGLFYYLRDGAVVRNVKIFNMNFTSDKGSKYGVGALCSTLYTVGEFENEDPGALIENCGVTGSIQGTTKAGGLIGSSSSGDGFLKISNSYTKVNFTMINSGSSGGLMGGEKSEGVIDIENCYWSGSTNATRKTLPIESPWNGCFEWPSDNIVRNCYYNKTLFTLETATKATGLTTTQFADSSNFTGWDFENTWIIKDGYPELRIFLRD